MKTILVPGIFLLVLGLISCDGDTQKSDAYGNFEATEILISSEVNGKIQELSVVEGQRLEKGQQVGWIDSTQLYLKKQQLIASIAALKSKLQDIKPQIDVLLEQKSNLTRELERFTKLKADGAATDKQLDDIRGEIDVVNSKILATNSQLSNVNTGIKSEIHPLEIQIDQVNDQLSKCRIQAPNKGVVLAKYAEPGEVAVMGKPLLKTGDLDTLDLRVYISGDQLSQIKIGDQVEVLFDSPKGLEKTKGTVSWIANEAEFTPKIVQTRDERVNLVYAIKVKVKNNGSLKIGMPGEVQFLPKN